jgi:hypothetical protein
VAFSILAPLRRFRAKKCKSLSPIGHRSFGLVGANRCTTQAWAISFVPSRGAVTSFFSKPMERSCAVAFTNFSRYRNYF